MAYRGPTWISPARLGETKRSPIEQRGQRALLYGHWYEWWRGQHSGVLARDHPECNQLWTGLSSFVNTNGADPPPIMKLCWAFPDHHTWH
jgi:hypothetical protein